MSRFVVTANSPYDDCVAVIHKFPFPFYPREVVVRLICVREPGDSLLMFMKSLSVEEEAVDHGLSSKVKAVRLENRGFARFTPISANQCEYVAYLYFDVSGSIPVSVANKKVHFALDVVEQTRAKFQRDDEIDEEERVKLVDIMTSEQVYSEEEDEVLERVQVRERAADKVQSAKRQVEGLLIHPNPVLVDLARARHLPATPLTLAFARSCRPSSLLSEWTTSSRLSPPITW